jgi:colanic acid biosynthesis glycosyl transferase WcaI
MRVLLLNLYYPPDTSATAKMAQAIAEQFAQIHEITVLCGRPSYDPTERRPWRLWQTEQTVDSNITVIRVGSTDYPRIKMKRRILNYLSYTMLATMRALFVGCDVIFSMTDPPYQGITAAVISLLRRKPLLYDIQDLYPDMAVAGAIVRPGLVTRIWECLHRWALRRAAAIVVLGDDMRARVVAKGISPAKVHVVRNGADVATTSARTVPAKPDVISQIRGNFRFVVLHAGNLGFYGAWDAIVSAARQLDRDGVSFVFVGDGAERARLEQLAKGAANVRFLPFFPAEDISAVLAAPDLHLVSVKRGLEGVVVPSKMFGIMAAAKPILAVMPRDAEVAALGMQHGFAVAADPNSADEIACQVRALASEPSRVAVMGQRAVEAAAEYARAAELSKLTAILQDAVIRSRTI